MAELSRQEREERIRQIDAMLRMLKAQDAVDLVETPSPEAVADDGRRVFGSGAEARSVDVPVRSHLIDVMGERAGGAVDDITAVPFKSDGGTPLERAALFAAAPAAKAANVGKMIGKPLMNAAGKAGKFLTRGETLGMITALPAVVDGVQEWQGEERIFGDDLEDSLTKGAVTAVGLGAGRFAAPYVKRGAEKAAKKAASKAKRHIVNEVGPAARQSRMSGRLLPTDGGGRRAGVIPPDHVVRRRVGNRVETYPDEKIKAAKSPSKAERRVIERQNVEDAIERKLPFPETRRRNQEGKFISDQDWILLKRAQEQIALEGKLSRQMKSDLKRAKMDLFEKHKPKDQRSWKKALAQALDEGRRMRNRQLRGSKSSK